MRLFDRILENKELKFIDFASGKVFTDVGSLQFKDAWSGTSRKLVFLYIDNSLRSIQVLLHFLAGNETIVLLSNSLNDSLKQTLEASYKPNIVFDLNRTTIDGFESSDALNGLADIFIRSAQIEHAIHSKVRLLLSTSGTTGSPKFVKLSEENILQNALSIIQYLPIVPKDVTPLNLPVHYSYGLSVLTSNAIAGGTIYCTVPDVLDKKFWSGMSEFGFTSLAGVPFVYEMLKRIGFTKKEYLSLRYFTQAGGKLSTELTSHYAEYAAQHQVAFYVMYGQTEATARMSYLDPKDLAGKIGSIGKPIPNGTFSIDEVTHELIYTGPNVFGGYAESVADLDTYADIPQLHTGDVARVDEDGFYYITGRLKRFVKLFGNRINLDEIEQQLKNTIPNSTFVSVGLNDKVLLIVYNNHEVKTDEIRNNILNRFSIHPSALKVEFLNDIPLTQNGKVNYTAIVSMYGSE